MFDPHPASGGVGDDGLADVGGPDGPFLYVDPHVALPGGDSDHHGFAPMSNMRHAIHALIRRPLRRIPSVISS